MPKTINHSIMVKGSPHEVYEMLLDSKQHAQLIGSEATSSPDVGGEFSLFNNAIVGHNVELVPDRKIVQKWRAGDWEDGHYSTATFELKQAEGGTELVFTQLDVPDEHYESINQGWFDNYWNNMGAMFGD